MRSTVVAGGVTVFGAYFLFLEDWLKKPPQKKAAETKSEATDSEADKKGAAVDRLLADAAFLKELI